MSQNAKLYGLLAEFTEAELLIEAIHAARGAGYRPARRLAPARVDGVCSSVLRQGPTKRTRMVVDPSRAGPTSIDTVPAEFRKSATGAVNSTGLTPPKSRFRYGVIETSGL